MRSNHWSVLPAARVASAALLTLTVWLVPPTARGAGGDDVRVLAASETSDGFDNHRPQLAIASDGTQYALAVLETAVAAAQNIVIHRSTDGGQTWSLWSDLAASTALTHFDKPDLAVGTTATGHRVFVLALGDPGNDVHLFYSDNGPTAVWQEVLIDAAASGVSRHNVVATRDVPMGNPIVGVAYVGNAPFNGLRYRVSGDGGSSFEPAVDIYSFLSSTATRHALTLDDSGIAHLAWTDIDTSLEVGVVGMGFGLNDGELAADWTVNSPEGLFSSDIAYVDIASSPLLDDVVVAVGAKVDNVGGVRIYRSSNEGVSWFYQQYLPDFTSPVLAWSPEGLAFVASEAPSTHKLVQSTFNFFSNWEAEQFTDSNGDYATPSLAFDPTRDNRWAMLGLHRGPLAPTQTDLYFDADWRADPGYGVSEFGTPIAIPGGNARSSPALADLDGDGQREIVFTTDNETVVAYDLALGGWRFEVDAGPVHNGSLVAVHDLDGDGTREVVVGDDEGIVRVFQSDGTVRPGWPYATGSGTTTFVSIAPVTGYTNGEVLAANGSQVWLLGPNGTPRDGWPVDVGAFGSVVGPVSAADLDQDGMVEVVVSASNAIVILDPAANPQTIHFTSAPLAAVASLANVEGDNRVELVFAMENGLVDAWSLTTGRVAGAWPSSTGGSGPMGPIALANLKGDALREVCFVSDGTLHALDGKGKSLPGYPQNLGVGLHGPVVNAVGPAANTQLLLSTDDVWALAVDAPDGAPVTGWPRELNGTAQASPAIADLDADGRTEAVLLVGSTMWVLDMGVTPAGAAARWKMEAGNARRTSCNGCNVPAPTAAPAPSAARVSFASPWPNPSSGDVDFAFRLPEATAVQLDLVDVRGRRVRTLVDRRLAEGPHRLQWDGRDHAGQTVASGVYFARLAVGNHDAPQVRKVVRSR